MFTSFSTDHLDKAMDSRLAVSPPSPFFSLSLSLQVVFCSGRHRLALSDYDETKDKLLVLVFLFI
jgi:hypothetical protein